MAYLLWHGLAESAQRHPDRLAVACRGEKLTYRELDEESTRLANLLAAEGIGPGARVGIDLHKSPQVVVAMLGILKAGATYVPVDPNAPVRRVSYILGNCAVRGLVTTEKKLHGLAAHWGELPELRTVVLTTGTPAAAGDPAGRRFHAWETLRRFPAERIPASRAVELDPAYILYTSGSTGTPKGVVLSHRNALTFVDWGVAAFRIGPEDRLSNHAPMHFDLSVFDVYVALQTGASVNMVPETALIFPLEVARWIETERISIWYSVPSALTQMLLHGQLERFRFEHLRAVLFAGEVFPVKYLRDVMQRLQQVEFYNLYGPTETNVCTYYRVPPLPADRTADISIGAACDNTDVFAVTEDGRVAGPGEEGELLVRGGTVMLGYWGLPEKTAQMLIPNPVQTAYPERVYRTGDYVRPQPDGNFQFVGRRDNMVKSRGYRIELGEIEQTLYQHPKIREAVVLAVPDQEIGARLQAVIVPHPGADLVVEELRGFCLARLPRYMVPEEFLVREQLPQTSTGKTDRVQLRAELGL